jgi:NodT family efflux transporter outer membrane factor (OMF) lipoprotein
MPGPRLLLETWTGEGDCCACLDFSPGWGRCLLCCLSQPLFHCFFILLPFMSPRKTTSTLTRSTLGLLSVATVVLAGCATPGPDHRPAAMLTAQKLGVPEGSAADASVANAADLQAGSDWWTTFDDATLSGLIEQSLAAHPTLAQARARLAEAAAMAGASQASKGVQIGFDSQVARERFTENSIYSVFGGKVYNAGTVESTLSWNPDFFGKLDAQWAASVGEMRAAQADVAAARLALSTQVARVYLQLGRLVDQRAIAEKTLAQRDSMRNLTVQRVRAGLDTSLERTQSEGALPDVRNQIEALDEQIMIARHALAALTVQPMNSLDHLSPSLPEHGMDVALDRVSANLLGRRPDVVAARWRVESTAQNVRAAEAQFYPDINLSAAIGLSSLGLSNVFKSSSFQYSYGPALRLPIFDAGLLRSQLHGRQAEQDAAVGQYNNTLLTAVREASDAMGSIRSLERQQELQDATLASAEKAWDIAKERYRAGLSSYLSVLSAEGQWLSQNRLAIDLHERRAEARIALISALGGGWQDDTGSARLKTPAEMPVQAGVTAQ